MFICLCVKVKWMNSAGSGGAQLQSQHLKDGNRKIGSAGLSLAT